MRAIVNRFDQGNQARCSTALSRARNGLSPVASLTSTRMFLITHAEH